MKIGAQFAFQPSQFFDVDHPVCAIIRLHDGSVNPAILLQAVLDPGKVSPDGQSLRFTSDSHCEVHGWKPLDKVEIVEVLEDVREAEK